LFDTVNIKLNFISTIRFYNFNITLTYVNSYICNELKHFLFKLIEIKAVLNKVEFGQFASAQ
jgi:hypothetical protein